MVIKHQTAPKLHYNKTRLYTGIRRLKMVCPWKMPWAEPWGCRLVSQAEWIGDLTVFTPRTCWHCATAKESITTAFRSVHTHTHTHRMRERNTLGSSQQEGLASINILRDKHPAKYSAEELCMNYKFDVGRESDAEYNAGCSVSNLISTKLTDVLRRDIFSSASCTELQIRVFCITKDALLKLG